MPIYEYVCEKDGEVIELLRPMRDADAPVEDPKGRGRTFVRKHSAFGVGGSASEAGGMSLPMSGGGCCPCGKSHGSCGSGA
ncbi:MAG: zinc ribbon domain-containing protein [Phycisphaerales bacterium]